MTEIKIYVGLNDVVTKQQEHYTDKYVEVMRYVCQSYHVSFSFIVTEGGFFHEDGSYVQEKALVLSLIDPDKSVVEDVAETSVPFSIRNLF
ncbi:MAG: hypothetical protein IJ634_01695 [Bacteroidales bacterium]|nr:hypothetical protein [Bacteroidales bacterium]